MTASTCGNCDAPLSGPYCSQCGQHTHHSARTIGLLFHDAWHDLTHVDGRVWGTFGRLLIRPGQLTLDYFAEKRARYVPPFRLYLILSIVFFGLWSLNPGDHVRADLPAPPKSIANDAKHAAEATGAQIREETVAQIKQGIAEAKKAKAASEPKSTAGDDGEAEDGNSWLFGEKCDASPSLGWLKGAAERACLGWKADHGKALLHAFFANVPKMMFVFLPLIAAVMTLLYWFPRRYYVEHVVLVLHNHAALYLAMILMMVIAMAARVIPGLGRVVPIAGFAVFCYSIWYVYRSMRRYYGQGRWLTLAKLSVVSFAYLIFLSITLVGTLIVSALVTS